MAVAVVEAPLSLISPSFIPSEGRSTWAKSAEIKEALVWSLSFPSLPRHFDLPVVKVIDGRSRDAAPRRMLCPSEIFLSCYLRRRPWLATMTCRFCVDFCFNVWSPAIPMFVLGIPRNLVEWRRRKTHCICHGFRFPNSTLGPSVHSHLRNLFES